MLNLSVILEDSARRFPQKDAFIFADTHLSYAQINGAANQIANGLIARGIKQGDKVALNCLNLPYFPMVYFGILKAGAVVVPLSVLLKKDEIAHHLKDSGAKACFAFVGIPELPMAKESHAVFVEMDSCEYFFIITAKPTDASPIEGVETLGMLMNGQSPKFEMAQTNAEDTAVIIYTSGTTGQPKGAELTHSSLLLNAILSSNILNSKDTDNQLIVLPLFHIFAMTCLMNAGVYKGTTNVLLPRFDAETVLGLMSKHAISIFILPPSQKFPPPFFS